MQLDPNPLYRKVIIPWYDSEPACFFVIVFMFLIFLFGMVGISVANETHPYQLYVWVPAFLVIMSVWVIVSTTIRLIKRYVDRVKE